MVIGAFIKILKYKAGRRAGDNKQRSLHVHILVSDRNTNHVNLHAIYIYTQPYNKPWSQKQLHMCVANTQSIAHKADEMVLYITENDIQEDLKPTGYDLKQVGGQADCNHIQLVNIKVQVLDPTLTLHSDAFKNIVTVAVWNERMSTRIVNMLVQYSSQDSTTFRTCLQ